MQNMFIKKHCFRIQLLGIQMRYKKFIDFFYKQISTNKAVKYILVIAKLSVIIRKGVVCFFNSLLVLNDCIRFDNLLTKGLLYISMLKILRSLSSLHSF